MLSCDCPTHDVSCATVNSGVIWQYWQGRRPSWVNLFHGLVKRHNPNVVMLTPKMFLAFWKDDHVDLSGMKPHLVADFIRAYMLRHYGGMWLDVDCVVMKPFKVLFQILGDKDLLLYDERQCEPHVGFRMPQDLTCNNSFVIAPANSPTVIEWYERIREGVASGDARRSNCHSVLSKNVMTPLARERQENIKVIDGQLIMPLHWSHGNPQGDWFVKRTDEEHEEHFNSTAYSYMLTRGACHHTRQWSRERWINGREFVCFLVRKSLARTGEPSWA